MRDAITKRISRRSYTGEPLNPQHREQVRKLISQLNQESGLTMELLDDGGQAFGSMKKSYGFFKNVCSVILLKGPKDLNDLFEKVGYYGESLMLDLVDLDLGTCWVGGTYDADAYDIPSEEKLVCVMPVGYVSEKATLIGKAMVRAHTMRKPLEERIRSDVTPLPSWIRAGMEAVIPAPSAVNRQKPHFEYENGFLSASVSNTYEMDLVDLGIAKFHFVCEAGGHFDFGNGGRYHK